MSTLVFEIRSPQADTEVPRTFSVLAVQRRDPPHAPPPYFRIDSVQLQFGPGGSTVDAVSTGILGWAGTGTLPPGTKGGDTVTVTATAQLAGLNIITYLTAYFDECGRNGGKPLAGEALDPFLPWKASPEELRLWAQPPPGSDSQ